MVARFFATALVAFGLAYGTPVERLRAETATPKNEIVIVEAKPTRVRLVNDTKQVISENAADNRITYDVQFKVLKTVYGEYDDKYVTATVKSHSAGAILSSSFMIVIRYKKSDITRSAYKVNKISCVSDNSLPEDIIYNLRYNKSPYPESSKCILID